MPGKIQRQRTFPVQILSRDQAFLQHLPGGDVSNGQHRLAGIAAIAAGCGQNDPGLRISLGADGHHAIGRNAQEIRQLLDDRLGERWQALLGAELTGAANDFFEAATTGLQTLDLVERTNCRCYRGEQLASGQLALGLVIVDIVVGDGVEFGRIAGLPGSQDDPHRIQSQIAANRLDRLETGVFALHDHIEQNDGNVATPRQQADGLRCAEGMKKLQRPAQHSQIAQRKLGGVVHILIVVNDQQIPANLFHQACFGRQGVIEQSQLIVVTKHFAVRMGFNLNRACSMAARQ